jgi:hypothetical protein
MSSVRPIRKTISGEPNTALLLRLGFLNIADGPTSQVSNLPATADSLPFLMASSVHESHDIQEFHLSSHCEKQRSRIIRLCVAITSKNSLNIMTQPNFREP